MKIVPTEIDGASVVETDFRLDSRGSFARLYCEEELSSLMGKRQIVQINYSSSRILGAVRGLHYQRRPNAEVKLVRCLKGRVFDVLVDLRTGSRNFLQWHSEELSADNARMLLIPEGCAHGFQVLEAESLLLYLHTASYEPDSEGGIRVDDPAISINWPLPISHLSERDRNLPLLSPTFEGLEV